MTPEKTGQLKKEKNRGYDEHEKKLSLELFRNRKK